MTHPAIEAAALVISRHVHVMEYGENVWREGELDAKAAAYRPRHDDAARAAIRAFLAHPDVAARLTNVLDASSAEAVLAALREIAEGV